MEKEIDYSSSLTQNGCNPGIPIAVLSAEYVRDMSVHLKNGGRKIF